MACLLAIESIFEADFLDCSYGFPPGRSTHQAIRQICQHVQAGFMAVYDADLTKPHVPLIKTLEAPIADRQIIKLIQGELKGSGNRTRGRRGRGRRTGRGRPRGAAITPAGQHLPAPDGPLVVQCQRAVQKIQCPSGAPCRRLCHPWPGISANRYRRLWKGSL